MKKIATLLSIVFLIPTFFAVAVAGNSYDVVLTNTSLGIGHIITDSDVRMETVARADVKAARSINDVVGKRLKRPIGKNNAVKMNYIEERPLIAKGEAILIVATSGTMTVTTRGVAKENGAMGTIIKVANANSGKVVNAKVVGPATASVNF